MEWTASNWRALRREPSWGVLGESMFHVVTDASKIALCKLVERLQQRSYRLLDVQWLTPHLAQFGAIEIDRREYLATLELAMKMRCQFGD